MQIADVITNLEKIAPLHLQEDYDNAGLIVGNPNSDITGMMVCLDSTPEVIDEAIAKGCNLVVAHHPIIFRGLKQITGSNYVEQTVVRAIKNDIAIYAIHTNLDNVLHRGVNQKIADKLGLKDLQILRPKSPDDVEVGAGIVGVLESAMTEDAFLSHVKSAMHASVIRHTSLLGKSVTRVAVCGGSGSFLLADAIKAEADIFITADFKYHEFFDAEEHLVIADIGHYESEQFTIDLLVEYLSSQYPESTVIPTSVRTNPIRYST